jgi:hypothetical protein
VGAFWKCSYHTEKISKQKTLLFEKSCTKKFLNNQRGLAMLELPSDRVYEYSCPVPVVNDLSIRGDSKNGCSLVNICHSAAPINASDYKQDGP